MLEDYTMGGEIALKMSYRDDSDPHSQKEMNKNYTKKVFQECVTKISKYQSSYYGKTDECLYKVLAAYPIEGKDVCVIGSAHPWYESMCVHYKAKSVTVIEYSKRTSFDKRIVYVQPYDNLTPLEQFFLQEKSKLDERGNLDKHCEINRAFLEAQQKGKVGSLTKLGRPNMRHKLNKDLAKQIKPFPNMDNKFDVCFSISSFEHDGLGRYGDPLNPNGDLESMNRMKTILKPDGIMFLALPVGPDTLWFNVHRVYGPKRLRKMFESWKVLSYVNFDPNTFLMDHDTFLQPNPKYSFSNNLNNGKSTTYQPVFVLQNSDTEINKYLKGKKNKHQMLPQTRSTKPAKVEQPVPDTKSSSMLIIEDMEGHYSDALEHHYDYSRFTNKGKESDTVFLHGMGCIEKSQYKIDFKNYEKKVYFNYEQPCALYGDNAFNIRISTDVDKFFDKIYTACPYTAKWINDIEKENRFEIACHPFNEKEIVSEKEEKEYDTLYWGNIHNLMHQQIVNTISNYRYNFLTLGPNYWGLRDDVSKQTESLITGNNMPRQKMWSLIRKTKINIIVNLLFLNPKQIDNIKKLDNWERNEAFSHLELGIIPQQKTRAIESAINKCLMLVRRDPWNVIEHWFEPDVDFIYYDDEEGLIHKINHILLNWDSYNDMIEHAFQKVVNNYTTKQLIHRMQKN